MMINIINAAILSMRFFFLLFTFPYFALSFLRYFIGAYLGNSR